MHGFLPRIAALFILISMAIPLHSGSGGPVPPETPEEPSVRPAGEKEPAGVESPALLVTARGGKMRGVLQVGVSILDVPVHRGDSTSTVRISISDIDSIEFLRWRGREIRKGEFAFRPVRVRITLRDGTVMESAGHIAALARFTLREGGRVRTVFSCFHDYRKNGRWAHSGATGIDHPETNPHGDTLVRIVFEKPAAFNPLEMLFKKK
ncbi:MAG: hypothetical protein JW838_14420 [Spirochaetes bacterium]|nr:hypothetical protein [Spirochaetota bacterium]